VFSHPAGGSVEITWTIEQAKAANLSGKDVWKAYPRAMLRARCISEGIRTVFPACIVGTYTPEEIDAMPPEPRHVENLAAAVAPAPAPAARPASEALPLIGPDGKEHAAANIEAWHTWAQTAIGRMSNDPAALRAWADANLGAFGAVKERYPDTVADIRAAITARLESVTEQETAE
jgi:hypothetical protein